MGNDANYNPFSNYTSAINNPGLLQWTVICCLLLFLLGFLAIPGKILHPISKRFQEYIAWWQSRLDGDDDDDNDDESNDGDDRGE
mmetsp:Transcript_24283/g.37104  ORF Transcript_24283/g.37104 Transcript_24283/m.37104 type:complete len:85 (+) Transcript_24283:249-503(+)